METRKILTILVLGLGLAVWPVEVSEAGAMQTAFTYQGRLIDANDAAEGVYDLNFGLYNSASDGNQVGGDVNVPDVDVIDGYFTVELDFGSRVFDGDARWLELGIRAGELEDPNGYTTLSPRQELTPVPYALHTRWLHVDTALGNLFLGEDAGVSNTTGQRNSATGRSALRKNTEGNYNSAVGFYALRNNTTGHYNSAMGYYALYDNNDGNYNSAMGRSALSSNTTGSSNSAMGNSALSSNTTGNYNSAMGASALLGNTTGYYNSALGIDALRGNSTGNYNVGVGAQANYWNGEGSYNTIIGFQAGKGTSEHNKSGNVFLGYRAGFNETGSNKLYIANSDADPPLIYGEFDTGNVGIGRTSPGDKLDVNGHINSSESYKLDGQTVLANTGSCNIFAGEGAGVSNTTGIYNSAIGCDALCDNNEGNFNSAMGRLALGSNTTGRYNVGVGVLANYFNRGGSYNTIVGSRAGKSTSVHSKSGNVFLGYMAGYNETGDNKLYIANSDADPPLIYGEFDTGKLGIGTTSPAAKLTVDGAILREGSTMYGSTADTHINLGSSSTTGTNGQDYSSATVSGGYNNTASLSYATVAGGSSNTASGRQATVGGGCENTASGWFATISGGCENTASGLHSFAAGYRAKANHQGTFVWADSQIADFASTGNNQFIIRASGGVGIDTNSPSYKLDVNGDIQCVTLHETSDARFKTNIRQLTGMLEKVEKVRGVLFEWNEAAESVGATAGQEQIGLVAQEVEIVLPELVATGQNGCKSVDYTRLTAVLLEAVKELRLENEALRRRMDTLEEVVHSPVSGKEFQL